MKRMILIEDRVQRQLNFINQKKLFDEFPNLKNICGDKDYSVIKNLLSNKEFEAVFNEYQVIAIHRSALSTEERNKLIEYCKAKGKSLVFFSGGISSALLRKLNNSNLLTINSKDFYSENLFEFLKQGNEDLRLLAFGVKWELCLLIKLKDKLAIYVNNFMNDNIEFQELKAELNIGEWEIEIFKENIENLNDDTILQPSSLINVLSSLNKKIKSKIYE